MNNQDTTPIEDAENLEAEAASEDETSTAELDRIRRSRVENSSPRPSVRRRLT